MTSGHRGEFALSASLPRQTRPAITVDQHSSGNYPSRLAAENARLRRQVAWLAKEAELNDTKTRRLHAMALQLLDAPDLPGLFERLTTGLAHHYEIEQAVLVILDPAHEVRHLAFGSGRSSRTMCNVTFIDRLYHLPPRMRTLREPWLGPYDPAEHDETLSAASGLRSAALIPLRRGSSMTGIMLFASTDVGRYCPSHSTDFLAYLGSTASFALENAINRTRLLHDGLTDALTGLHNRRYMESRLREELVRSCRTRSPVSFVLLDVDRFKQVNDRFGHPVGDEVLSGVAQRIASTVRGHDVCARYGGEEFAILFQDTDLDRAAMLADRVRQRVCESAIGLERALTVSISAGVASLIPESRDMDTGVMAKDLISRADHALYRAKKGGRNRVETAS